MNESQVEATVVAEAHTSNAALPTYSELLILDDHRNIACNVIQPNDVKIESPRA